MTKLSSLSVIIPTLNEERYICEVLSNVRCELGEDTQIIVVDGGSRDRTIANAGTATLILEGAAGRGKQMNLGAAHASGDVLLFLHADTQLPPSYRSELVAALSNSSVIAGYSPICFDHPGFMLRLYSRMSRLTFRLFHYGDGAVFVRRAAFQRIGRYREIPLFEDLDLLSRLRRTGNIVLLSSPVQTSARRFLQRGVVVNQLTNVLLVMLYIMGLSPHVLSRWYSPPGAESGRAGSKSANPAISSSIPEKG
ncbi:MAG: TIGR04283 family arsenosugar biosynthesis glycosyltransferase [Ignavibacteria bacterium]|nr:TIGR04283 family arsenosugar biosynthesis glycosyltransferase [Ignavibacteria bacterium]